jgi:hypothetical protein
MRNVLALALGALALVFVVAYRRVLSVTQRPSWPPPVDAVTPAGAQVATEAFAARGGTRPHDAALPFAWATAATIDPWAEGVNFFPKIFADVEAASSSVHILMFGWREGEVGLRMAALLERKLAEGVEVRVIVDGFGSRPYKQAREMFTGLAGAGGQIVVNDVFPLDRDGLYPDGQRVDVRQDEVGRADHRNRGRRRQLRHREPGRLGALPQLGDHDDRPQRRNRRAHRGEALRAGHRPLGPR